MAPRRSLRSAAATVLTAILVMGMAAPIAAAPTNEPATAPAGGGDPVAPTRAAEAEASGDLRGADSAATLHQSRVFVANTFGGTSGNYDFLYGKPSSVVTTGDWDGDGKTGFALRSANVFTLADEKGYPAGTAAYGRRDDVLVIGDWDGNGTDTFGVRRGNRYLLRNSVTTGVADIDLGYGRADDEVFVGDWDGNGTDTFAVRRGNVFYVRNSPTTGVADVVFGYGRKDDEVLVGDWNGDGVDTFAVRRGNRLYLRNDFRTGVAETDFAYGLASDQMLVGDWDGNGIDTFAARRVYDGPVPITRTIGDQSHSVLATTGGVTLVHPSTRIELVGFHQASHPGSQALDVADTAVAWATLPTRFRGTHPHSAADVVVEPGTTIVSPVTGTVRYAGTYALYCTYRDDFVYIEPDGHPGWEVRIFHIDGVRVGPGARVTAGTTVLAPRATQLPFASQVDAFTGEPSWPHVHIEVVDPSVPRPGGGC